MKFEDWLHMQTGWTPNEGWNDHLDTAEQAWEYQQKRIVELETFLKKLRDSGDWYWSALEFNIYGTPHADGDKLKQELDVLLEDK